MVGDRETTHLFSPTLHVSCLIVVYFRQKPIEHEKAMNNKLERQTEYKRTETATKRHMHTMK